MAVSVRLAGPTNREPKTHPSADDMAVDDMGCLVVTSGDGKDEKTLALYAPGVWASAEVL